MPFEVKLKDRIARVELLSRQGDQLLVAIDGREYALDFVQIGRGSYSVLYKNKSFNLELIPVDGVKKYQVNTFKNTFDVEIIDAESKYLASRNKAQEDEDEAIIISPIPGKVVNILVEKDEAVQAGQTVIVISAMKMESEFKSPKAGKVTEIKVTEGQSVEARQELVVIEFDQKV